MEHYFYKSDSTLLCVAKKKSHVTNIIPSLNGGAIAVSKKPGTNKTNSYIKLSMFKDCLYVQCGSETTEVNGERLNQKYSEFLHPELGGSLVRYISMDMVEPIENFLNHYFPDTRTEDFDALTPVYDIEDLPTFDSNISQEDTEKICKLAYRIIMAAFPISSKFISYCMSDGFYKLSSKNTILFPYHRASTYREFLTKMFGVYRKDLAKAVSKHSMEAIEWVACFKGLLPDDLLITALNNCQKSEAYADISCNLDIHVLKQFPSNTIKNLLVDGLTNIKVDSFVVRDALDMCLNIPIEERRNIKTWQELHDIGMGSFRLKISDDSVTIKFEEKFENLFAEIQNDYNIQPLTHAKDFVEIGNRMELCINRSLSYISKAYNGEGVYFLMSDKADKDMIESKESVLVEVVKQNAGWRIPTGKSNDLWKVEQVYGYNNSSINSNYYRKIVTEKIGSLKPNKLVLDKILGI